MAEVQEFVGYSVVPLPGEEEQSSKDMFQRRLSRLQSGKVDRNVLWVGGDESHALPVRDLRRPQRRGRSLLSRIFYPIVELLALALGFFSYGAGLIVRYHVQGLPDPKANPDIDMAIQVVAGFLIAMVVGHLIGLRSRSLISVKALGTVAGLVLFHNLVHLYPHMFEQATSKLWVNQVLTHTKAHSLSWRGISLVF